MAAIVATAVVILASLAAGDDEPHANTSAVVEGRAGQRVTVLREGLVRVQLGTRPYGIDDRPTLVVVNRRTPVPRFVVERAGDALGVKTAALRLRLTPERAGRARIQLTCDRASTRWSAVVDVAGGIDDALLDALPPVPVSARGWYVLDDSRTARLEPDAGHASRPSRIAWWAAARPGAPTDLYLLCYGADVQEGTRQLAAVTGTPAMLPLAAYGVWYSGCCLPELYTQRGLSELVLAPHARLDLPLDVLVLDYAWHRGGWCGYSWARARFPRPEALREGLRSGANAYGAPLALMSNTHPGCAIRRGSEDGYDAFARAIGAEPSANQTFACNLYDVAWVTAWHDALLMPAMDWVWIDGNCQPRPPGVCGDATAPADLDCNVLANYALHALAARSGGRTLALNRMPGRADGTNFNAAPLRGARLRGALGAHRFPGAWTGDVPPPHLPPHFTPLEASVRACAEVAAGQLFASLSSDLGPYADAAGARAPVNARRFVRYAQWGAWSPLFRPHGGGGADTRAWRAPEPYRAALLRQLRLRGALVPYLYALARRAFDDAGAPPLAPMWFAHGATRAYARAVRAAPRLQLDLSAQFHVGDAVLVRPVLQWARDAGRVRVWLPPGAWCSWDGARAYEGSPARAPGAGAGAAEGAGADGVAVVPLDVGLDDTPALVRAGSALPLWAPGRRRAPPAERTIAWAVWPPPAWRAAGSAGASPAVEGGGGWAYMDDGTSLAYARGAHTLTRLQLAWESSGAVRRLRASVSPVAGPGYAAEPARARHALQLRGVAAALVESVVVNGEAIAPSTRGAWDAVGWWWSTAPPRQARARAAAGARSGPPTRAEPALTAGALVIVAPHVDARRGWTHVNVSLRVVGA